MQGLTRENRLTLNAVSFETIQGLNQTYTTLDTSMASNGHEQQAGSRVSTLSARGKKKTARAADVGWHIKVDTKERVAEKGSKLFCNRLERYFGRCRRILSRSYAHVAVEDITLKKPKQTKATFVQSKEEKKRNAKNARKRKKILPPTLPPETTDLLHSPHTIPPPLKIGGDGQSDSSHLDTMGGTQEKVAEVDRRKRGFNEADQEQLALAAHDGANRGKRGLGVGTTTVKSLKSEFVGKRFKFSDNLEEGVEGEVCTEMVKESLDGPTTVKVAKKIIKKAGGSMDLSDLLKKVMRKMSLNDDGHAQGMPEYQAKVKSHLKDCALSRDGKSSRRRNTQGSTRLTGIKRNTCKNISKFTPLLHLVLAAYYNMRR